jgi:uncharacterized protein YbbC (DUF1343 family)
MKASIMINVAIGIERIQTIAPEAIKKKRIGVLCNPASIDHQYRHASQIINDLFPGQLTALFSPQHGFFAEKQDNMIESENFQDPRLKIPIFSLYGQTRTPTPEMLDRIDVLLVDLLDVGTRVYTFTSTLSYCLEAAEKMKKHAIVLDRPNPINGLQVEGNCLSEKFKSFVGRYPIPMRHGLTIGEYSLYINDTYNIGCQLDVVKMDGWHRKMYYTDTGLPWVLPSPNLPTPLSAMVYPGQVIWEGTNISEGRGTTLPFEMFGSPFMDLDKILDFMGGERIPGAVLRPVVFEPTSNKWMGQRCKGFHIHVTDPYQYNAYVTSLKFLQAILFHHGKDFAWKSPPYEYEWEKLPFDLIVGDDRIRQRIERFDDIQEIQKDWTDELYDFIHSSKKYHLYP